MSWPLTSNGNNVLISGTTTTIVWGSGSFAQGSLAGYIVKNMKASERNEQIKIEQGAGLTAVNVLLTDGRAYEVTVVDDTNVTPPFGGSNVNVIIPNLKGPNAGLSTSFEFGIVINNDYNAARKVEGERVLLINTFNLFNP